MYSNNIICEMPAGTLEERNQILELYTKGPAPFPTLKQLYKLVKQNENLKHLNRSQLKSIVAELVPGVSVNAIRVDRFQRRPYAVFAIYQVWQADLAFFSSQVLRSNRIAALLVIVDIASKFAFVTPVKKKTSLVVAEAFKGVLERTKRKPEV